MYDLYMHGSHRVTGRWRCDGVCGGVGGGVGASGDTIVDLFKIKGKMNQHAYNSDMPSHLVCI